MSTLSRILLGMAGGALVSASLDFLLYRSTVTPPSGADLLVIGFTNVFLILGGASLGLLSERP